MGPAGTAGRGCGHAGIPALVVSTDLQLLERAKAHASRYGNHRYLTKPLDLDAMLQAIQEMIGEA